MRADKQSDNSQHRSNKGVSTAVQRRQLMDSIPWLADMQYFFDHHDPASVLKAKEEMSSGFQNYFAKMKREDESANRLLTTSDAQKQTLEYWNKSTRNLEVKKVLREMKPTYEKGKGIISVDEVFDTQIDEIVEKSDKNALTVEELVLIDLFKRSYTQVSARGRLISGSEFMLNHRATLSKFFAERFSYLMDLKKDIFGNIHRLPLKFLVYISKPENYLIRAKFRSSLADEFREIKSENNMISDKYDQGKVSKYNRKSLISAGSGRSRQSRGTIKHPAKDKSNAVGIVSNTSTYMLEEFDDQQFDLANIKGGKKQPVVPDRNTSADIGKKYELPQTTKTPNRFDIKTSLKIRQKQILKKFVRVYILQMEAPSLLRRYSFELPNLPVSLPASVAKINVNIENRRNFNHEDDIHNKTLIKMKKLNKMDFHGFRLKDHTSDEVTAFSHDYWRRTEKNQARVAKKSALEFNNNSLVSTNITAAVISTFPETTFKGLISMSLNSPNKFTYQYVVVIGYRMYIYENDKSKKAEVCFEIEPRQIEKKTNTSPGFFVMKNSLHADIYVLLDRFGIDLILHLEEIVAYSCAIHTLDLLNNLKSMTPILTDFFLNNQAETFFFKVLPREGSAVDESSDNGSKSIFAEKSFATSLTGFSFHPRLAELSIINIGMTRQMLDSIFLTVHKARYKLKILRFEYNKFQPEDIGILANYFGSDIFESLDEFSLSGNMIGDEGIENILRAIIRKLDVSMPYYRDCVCYPIKTLKLSHCGISNQGLSTIDEYVRNLEKIRLSTNIEKRKKYRFNIDLSRNILDDAGLMKITDLLRAVCSITNLNLDENYLATPKGISKFIGSLDYVHSLESISIREVYIPQSTIEYLQRFLYRNIFLNKIVLSFEKRSIKKFLSGNRSLTKYFRIYDEGTNCLANVILEKARN